MSINREKIKSLREAAGLTLAEAAQRAGWKGRQHWHAIESGQRLDPPFTAAQRIAAVLGVSLDELATPLKEK